MSLCLCVCRLQEKICVYPADVVLFEGILVFYTQEVRDMFHMKLFVDTDSDVRLSRRGTHAHTQRTFRFTDACICYIFISVSPVLCCVQFLET